MIITAINDNRGLSSSTNNKTLKSKPNTYLPKCLIRNDTLESRYILLNLYLLLNVDNNQ